MSGTRSSKLFSSQSRFLIIVLILFLIIASLTAYFLFFQISGADTDSSDITSPVISNLKVEKIDESSARISWTTNEPADGKVLYSSDLSFNQNTSDDRLDTNHGIRLFNLTEGTRYYYKVASKDAAGNQATSGEFITSSNGPIIIDNSSQTQSYGSGHNLTFKAAITDASPIALAKVHFGQGGATNINQWNFDLIKVGSSNNYEKQLAGIQLDLTKKVDYWLEVKDSAGQTSKSPADYPTSFSSITLTSPDTSAPTITYSPNPVPSQPSDTDLQIIAAIQDQAPGTIAEAKLHFKNSSDTNWQEAAMSAVNPGTTNSYKGVITKDKFAAGQNINFYFEAKDNSGNIGTYPTEGEGAPLSITLEWLNTLPTITHTPITSSSPDQTLRIEAEITNNTSIEIKESNLWWKNSSSGSFIKQNLKKAAGNTYFTTLEPSSLAPDQDLHYYLEVTNTRDEKVAKPDQAPTNYYTIDITWRTDGGAAITLPNTIQAINYQAKGASFSKVNHFLDNSQVMRAFTHGSESYLTYNLDFGNNSAKHWTLKVLGANGTNSLPPKPDSTMNFAVYLNQNRMQTLVLKATNNNFVEGFLDLGNQTGIKQLKLLLINDYYSPGNYDNNPAIKELTLEQRNIPTYNLPLNPVMATAYHKKGNYFHHRLSPLENLDVPVMVAFSNDPKASLQYKVDFGRDPKKNWLLKIIGANFGSKPKPNTVINLDVYIDRDGTEAQFIKIGNIAFPANGAEYQGGSLNLPTSSTGIKNIKLVFTNDYYHYDPNNPNNSYDNNALIRSIKIEQR